LGLQLLLSGSLFMLPVSLLCCCFCVLVVGEDYCSSLVDMAFIVYRSAGGLKELPLTALIT
jgi:hypothetical protein